MAGIKEFWRHLGSELPPLQDTIGNNCTIESLAYLDSRSQEEVEKTV